MNFVETNDVIKLDNINQYILGFDNFKNTGPSYLMSFINAKKHYYTTHKFYVFLTNFFDKNKEVFLNTSLSVSKYLKILTFIKKNVPDFSIVEGSNKIRLENYIAEADKLSFLYSSIKRFGYTYNENDPIILLYDNNEYSLIDGFHRFFVCKYLQIKELKVKIIKYEK